MKVLVVDDEEEICKRLQRELRKEGYEVDYTTSSVGVPGKLKEAKKSGKAYELLLLDLRMPEVGGFEILKEIRDARLDLDVIIITGYGDEDKAVEAIRLGAIDYLRKPISLEELHTALFRVRKKRAGKEKKTLKHRILVVDDEKELCARIKRELDKEGYETSVAYDGIEGLEYFKNNRVDMVIADIKMPGMNGLEMLEKCRAINPDFVPIIITGFGDQEKAITALRLGVFEYLRKPISLEELISLVDRGIEQIETRRGLSARKRELEIEATLKTQYAERIEREKKFSEHVINTIPDSLLVLDSKLRIKSANQTFYKTFQTELEEVRGSSIADIMHDKDGRLSTALTELFETEDMLKNFELHYSSEKLGERIFNIRARGMLIEEEEEEEEEELVVLEDVTERKWAEEALRASRKQLEETTDYLDNIIKSSADAIVVVDMKGIVRSWNKAAEDHMGYTADEVIGTSNKNFFADPEEAERIEEIVQREGEFKNYRTTVLNKDKRPVHISMSAALLKDREGMPIGTVRVSRDITKEVELEERIKEERDNLNLIFESMADGVYMVSKDYKVEFMNKVLIDEFGEHIGDICYEVFHDRKEPCPRCKNVEVMKGKTIRWEWHSHRMNKTYDLLETPRRNVDGTSSKLTIFRDITERKRAEEQIKASLKEKEVLLREIHHRVKNNLQVVSSLLSIQARAAKDKDTMDMLSESRNRINAMAIIHTQLYESSDLSEINMKGFVDKLLRQLLQSYPVHDTKITPIIHAVDYPFPISIAVPVGLIVNELLSNALKYAFVNRKKGKIEVRLSASETGNISLTVSDDGVGLPEGLDINATRTLGLRLVKILAEDQLQGNLEVTSKEGTTFKIEFDIETNGRG